MSDSANSLRPKRKLQTKLVLLVVMSVSTAVALVSGVSAWSEAERETSLEATRLSTTAAVLASLSERPTVRLDRAGAFAALRAIARMPGLAYGRIETADGRTLVETGRGARLSSDVQIDLGAHRAETSILKVLFGRSIEATAPILSGGAQVGRVLILGVSQGALQRLVDGLRLSLASALLALGAGILVAFRLQTGITRPIAALITSMADNDFTRNVEVKTDDEIGLLVHSFNLMIEELRERDARISAHVQGLEALVDARTQDLNIAKNAAEAANSAKSDFLATMSHEIRTPMNGIMVMAEMLAAGEMPPRQRRFAEVIAKSGSSLLAIINDVLDLSKIEAGKLELEAIPCDLGEIVDDVLSLFQERARARGLDLAAYVSPRTPAVIEGDPVRLRQVIGNLVNNAIKFTERGGVLVDVAPSGEDGVRIAVIDTGVGIAKDKLSSVFGAFNQADQSTTRRFGGTGLGLAICKRLVSAMGGRFELRSRVGAGSSFAFRWPAKTLEGPRPLPVLPPGPPPLALVRHPGLATRKSLCLTLEQLGWRTTSDLPDRPEDPSAAPAEAGEEVRIVFAASGERLPELTAPIVRLLAREEAPTGEAATTLLEPLRRCDLFDILFRLGRGEPLESEASPREAGAPRDLLRFDGLKALVADDSAVNREVAVEALQRLGVRAKTVEDGQKALEAARQGGFDLILMDGSMPELDGYDAARAIRSHEVASGAARVPIIALTAHVLGPQAEAWKAADMDAVLHKPFTLKALSAALALFHAPTEVSGDPEADLPDLGADAGQLIDPKVLADLALMAKGGRASFVRKVLKLYADHAPTALAAIRAAAERGDVEGMGRQGHALKSMSLNLGAREVARRAAEVEALGHAGVLAEEALLGDLAAALQDTLAALGAAPPEPLKDPRTLFRERLTSAISEERLHLLYQPQYDRDRTFAGSVEALVRWTEADGTQISPAEFVPLAERYGVVEPLTDFVFARALREIKPMGELRVACNASATEFSSPEFVHRIEGHLQREAFDPRRLEIEVTETAVLDDDGQVLENMARLQALGIKIALDDFGAGYSSLLHLRKFPFDKLKIDREFVVGCTEDAQAAAIVHAVISVGRAMGMKVVAEGVETEAQFHFLKLAGAHTIQGFLFARPITLEALRELQAPAAPDLA